MHKHTKSEPWATTGATIGQETSCALPVDRRNGDPASGTKGKGARRYAAPPKGISGWARVGEGDMQTSSLIAGSSGLRNDEEARVGDDRRRRIQGIQKEYVSILENRRGRGVLDACTDSGAGQRLGGNGGQARRAYPGGALERMKADAGGVCRVPGVGCWTVQTDDVKGERKKENPARSTFDALSPAINRPSRCIPSHHRLRRQRGADLRLPPVLLVRPPRGLYSQSAAHPARASYGYGPAPALDGLACAAHRSGAAQLRFVSESRSVRRSLAHGEERGQYKDLQATQ
ncbi:hypothetical protein C8R44DRAFT_753087 [Mycena epipterygia]|nr:hypothetical protein C8R44DRAFT_753087 [Mycena epipterygia]